MSIRFAQVVAVHPAQRTVDLVFLDDGWRCGHVQVMSGAAGSDCGVWSTPNVPKPGSEREAGGVNRAGRTVHAVCGFVGARPIVLGFVQPQGGQVAFSEQDRAVYRHPSGTYVTVAPDGSIEAYHPGGAYLRVGDGEHEDLGGKAAGGWSLPGAQPAQITLVTTGFKARMLPGGTVEVEADTSVTIKTPAFTVDSPQSLFTGAVMVDGPLTYKGGMSGSGGSGAAASIQGNVQVTGGDVNADGIGLKTHTHPDPQGGETAPPA
ncbi:hypothetical protein [Azospirillum sp.]|uniref:hypothetical protein n=1 Tax=Azospirillum sp. TaxID=34012 RepID=UPI003D7369D6